MSISDNSLKKKEKIENEIGLSDTLEKGPVPYVRPDNWLVYDVFKVVNSLCNAKAAVLALTTLPLQKSWAEKLQEIQLKYEVAGTSKIEGADFTERELDEALRNETPAAQLSRSQRQARAAVNAYRWIANLPDDQPPTEELILEIHRQLVTGCDEDHCEPGKLRPEDYNVTFGLPRHRGAIGGKEVAMAFKELARALQREFQDHDILIQGLALHYHLGSMHPFGDGNGRTARAVETLFLQKAGLKDQLFIALSNFYYDEKPRYLKTLAECRQLNHDITPFLLFGLEGIQKQCARLSTEITINVKKAMFRDLAHRLFSRLSSSRKRVIASRQMVIINRLLEDESVPVFELFDSIKSEYSGLKDAVDAYIRDASNLLDLGAIIVENPKGKPQIIRINLDWSMTITETKFFETIQMMPKAKSHKFLLTESE